MTVRNLVSSNKDKVSQSDGDYRKGLAKRNPVLVVPSSKILPWDKLPRIGMLESDIRKIYPVP